MSIDFVAEPFRPSRLWLNPHAQTILANSLRPTNGVIYRRVRLDTPDGDFLDLDFASVPGVDVGRDMPLVLLLHGLEGSARRSYASEMYRQLAGHGVRAVGMNFRSCSGVLNRTPSLYHAGKTDDVALVLEWLEQVFPNTAKGLVGFSLGANVLLKYLGEQGAQTTIRAAAAVSPPFDLGAIARTFDNGSGRYYAPRFMKALQQKALRHAELNGTGIDPQRLLQARTMADFDDVVTAPLHGFRDANDYYTRSSSRRFLARIRVPTLVIRALDDPLFGSDVPHMALAKNDFLRPLLVPHGGHVAFAEGLWPRKFHYWAERQAARFLSQFLYDSYTEAVE